MRQLLFSSGLSSIVPAAAGILAGALYRCNALGVRKAKVPDSIARFASTWIAPLLLWPSGSFSPSSAATAAQLQQRRRQQQQLRQQLQQQRAGHQHQHMPPPPPAPMAEPSAAHIESLVAMGFDRAAAEAGTGRNTRENDCLASLTLPLSTPLPTLSPPPTLPCQPPPPPPVAEPSAAHIESLVAMGFGRAAAEGALRRARNDLHLATNLLLEG
ncbi:unnamed protein product [Closterium sp. NIES-53]